MPVNTDAIKPGSLATNPAKALCHVALALEAEGIEVQRIDRDCTIELDFQRHELSLAYVSWHDGLNFNADALPTLDQAEKALIRAYSTLFYVR